MGMGKGGGMTEEMRGEIVEIGGHLRDDIGISAVATS